MLFSSLSVLSYDILLSVVSWNFFQGELWNNGQMLSQPNEKWNQLQLLPCLPCENNYCRHQTASKQSRLHPASIQGENEESFKSCGVFVRVNPECAHRCQMAHWWGTSIRQVWDLSSMLSDSASGIKVQTFWEKPTNIKVKEKPKKIRINWNKKTGTCNHWFGSCR